MSEDAAQFRRSAPTPVIPSPEPLARATDPETSHEAAQTARALAADHRTRIAAALATKRGNIYELGDACGLSHVQVARRLPEMERAKTAHPTDETRGGCRVWAPGPKVGA